MEQQRRLSEERKLLHIGITSPQSGCSDLACSARMPWQCVCYTIQLPKKRFLHRLTVIVYIGLRHSHIDIKAKQPQSPVTVKSIQTQDPGYGYVCQSFDCSDFYEVPGLKKSKAE